MQKLQDFQVQLTYSPDSVEYIKNTNAMYEKYKSLVQLLFCIIYICIAAFFVLFAFTPDGVHLKYGLWEANIQFGKFALSIISISLMVVTGCIELVYLDYVEMKYKKICVMLKYGLVTGLVNKNNGTNN